jgi:hypothetical protein
MSVHITPLVYETQLGNCSAKAILLRLADNSNDQGACFPSIDTIARDTEVSRRQVLRVIQIFRDMGLIDRSPVTAPWGDTMPGFQINLKLLKTDLREEFARCHRKAQCKPDVSETQDEECLRDAEPVSETQNYVSETLPPHPLNGRTVIEPSLEPSQAASKNSSLPMIPTWIPKESWDGFVAMRKKIGAPLTPRAVTLTINELDKLRMCGHPPGPVLDQSVMRSWRGVFELKGANGNGGNGNWQSTDKGIRSTNSVRRNLQEHAGDEESGPPSSFLDLFDAPSRDDGRTGRGVLVGPLQLHNGTNPTPGGHSGDRNKVLAISRPAS